MREGTEAAPLETVPVDRVARQMDEYLGTGWLGRVGDDPGHEALQSQRAAIEAQARRDGLISLALALAWFASLLLMLFAVVRSTHRFYTRLHQPPFVLRRPLSEEMVTQLLVGVLAVMAIGGGDAFVLHVMFAPAVFVILLAECFSFIAVRRVRRKPART